MPTYQTFETLTNPSAKTISIGLPGLLSTCRLVFAVQPRQFYHDETPSCHLPGPDHHENFILTGKLASIYRDCCKNRSSNGATYYTAGPLPQIFVETDHSASRTTSNKIYREMIPSALLPNCTATLNLYFQTFCFA